MKKIIASLKWIGGQARPILFNLFFIIILGAIFSLCSVYRAIVLKKLIDSATAAQMQHMARFTCILAILILADVALQAVISIITSRCSTNVSNNIQKKLYARLSRIKWLEYSRYHSGDILTRMTNDTDAVTGVLVRTLPNIISLIVMLVSSFIALLFYNRFLAVLSLIMAPVTVLIGRFYAKKLKNFYTRSQEIETEYRSFLHESIQNMTIIKAFCAEKSSMAQVENIQNKRLESVLSRSRASALTNSVFSLGSWLGFFIVFSWGSLNMSKGIITYGTLMALGQLFANIQGPSSSLAYSLPQIVYAVASAERLMELEALALDNSDSEELNINSAGIQLENVNFDYKKNEPILKNISARIYPGETVALVGPSGEGKTTLIRLLLSLIYPQKGHVYITNNTEKYEINASSRKLISYVPQGNTLFSGTIASNLRYGCPDAGDTELEAAARAACAWEFIESLPDKLNTVIGERGLGLSEGQAQRLAIARALLRKAPILILDEATSALDVNTEIKVLETIRNLKPVRTCIIITHRLTALKICHRVFKLEDGCLNELYDQTAEDPAIEAV